MEYDSIKNPKHYVGNCSLECIEVMRLMFGDSAVAIFCACNAFKYLWRHEDKGGKEDLLKAKWYLDYYENELDSCVPIISAEIIERLEALLNKYLD